jgi:tRNA threonylcarbamoyladenosine biosynthesis protein TsaE
MLSQLNATRTGFLVDEAKTLALGEQLARLITAPAVIYLSGDLGAGKTTFSRGFLRARGHQGSVKSPTYTLVEPYEALPDMPVFHLDLYRLGSPDELAYLGLGDYLAREAIVLIEWAERALSHLPSPTFQITLAPEGDGRGITVRASDAALINELVF